jgi:phenylpropionate dioxygenase-like ring-hydroxylating dioxygenase large terminal subunit
MAVPTCREVSSSFLTGFTMSIDADDVAIPTEMQRTLPVASYRSEEVFADECEQIFWRGWFCAAREEALPAPGDYLSVEVAGQSVLIVRDRSGGLRGYYNVCRHRGSQLSIDDGGPDVQPEPCRSGRFKGSIVCPYHAWTYGLDGSLRAAPFLNESDGLRREDLSLHALGVETWAGYVLVNLSPWEESPSLLDQLDGADARTRRYPLAELRSARRIVYDVRANWKCIVENYNECYHCGPVHPELCEIVPAFKADGGANLDWDNGIPHRPGATTFTLSGTTDRMPFADLSEAERERHKGDLIYPNLMIGLSADHVASFTLWPKAPDRTVIACDFLFHPDEIAKPTFDPSDAVEFWDLVNRQDWRICESVQRGMAARMFEFGYYAPMENLSLDVRRYIRARLDRS